MPPRLLLDTPTTTATRPRPGCVLVVDDSPSLRRMLRFTLEQGRYDVLEAVDGTHALALAGERDVDLVLTDLNLPGIDGLTLVRSLRARAGFAAVPILVLTTETADATKAEARAAGATGWMVKPFDPDHLLDVVGRVMG